MEVIKQYISRFQYYLVKFDYLNDKQIIDSLINKATELSSRVNPYSSGAELRSSSTRINKLLGGLLTEVAVIEILNKESRASNAIFQILDSTLVQEPALEKLGFNQVDLKLRVQDSTLDLEIRSSFSYKTSIGRLFGFPLFNGKGAFSIIGWYTSTNKPAETRKDYYIFGIHYYHPDEILTKVKDKVQVHIAGAVSKETLERIGYNDSLKMYGATFRIINPIKDAPNPISGFKEILKIT